MSSGPTKVGTNTTTSTSTPYNADYLTRLWDKAETQYGQGSTNYEDPNLTAAYGNYLGSGSNLAQTTAPVSYGAWNNAVSGGLGVTNSPVYWDLWNMGKGQTPTQLNMTGYSSGLSDIADRSQSTAEGYASNLSDIASRAPGVGQKYADQTSDYGAGAVDAGNRYGSYLTGAAGDAVNAGNQYGSYLRDAAGNVIGAGNQYGSYLTDYAREAADTGNRYGSYLTGLGNRTLGSTDAYQNTLRDTASGAYLNANPYLNDTFRTAAGQVARTYQTATAPQTDSRFEGAQGRYGSGALANARSQNEQNLGSTLSGLASDIYGGNYARERAAQNAAAQAGGQLSLAESDAARQAYRDAATAGLGGYTTGISGLSNASQAALTGYGTGITGLSDASRSALTGYGTGITGLSDASRATLAGYGQGSTSAADAGKLALSGLEGARLGYTGAANTANTGYNTASDAYRNAGAVDTANLNAQYSGLNSLQSGYDSGNRNLLYGLGQTGEINKAQVAPYDTAYKGAYGLDTAGQETADVGWKDLNSLSGILGKAIQGDTSTSQPIYGKSWTDRLLGLGGTLGGAALGGPIGASVGSSLGNSLSGSGSSK